LGDVFAYPLGKATGELLLLNGNDSIRPASRAPPGLVDQDKLI
jgi:hypothetical protein